MHNKSFRSESILKELNTYCSSMPTEQKEFLAGKEITTPHRELVDKLLIFLKSINYEGVIELDTLIVKRDGPNLRTRSIDLYLPELNITIEVDGCLHDKSNRKINMDNSRDAFYAELGLLPPYRMDNEDVLIKERSSRNCRELLALIKEQQEKKRQNPEMFARAMKTIDDGRKAFYKRYSALYSIFPSLSTPYKNNQWVKRHLGLAISKGKQIQE
jgi:very-short-patch-repair endonuclease